MRKAQIAFRFRYKLIKFLYFQDHSLYPKNLYISMHILHLLSYYTLLLHYMHEQIAYSLYLKFKNSYIIHVSNADLLYTWVLILKDSIG